MLRQRQIKELFDLPTFTPCSIGNANFKTIVDSIFTLQRRICQLDQDSNAQIGRHLSSLTPGGDGVGLFKEEIAKLKDHILRTAQTIRQHHEEDLKRLNDPASLLSQRTALTDDRLSSWKSTLDGLTAVEDDEAELDSRLVFTNSSWSRHYKDNLILAAGESIRVSSNPISDNDRLKDFLRGQSARDVWSSPPNQPNDPPSITIEFPSGVRVIVRHYRLRSPHSESSADPSMVGWVFEGRISGQWHSLDEQRNTQILCDGQSHRFYIASDRLIDVEAIRLRLTPAKDLDPSQLHLSEFKISGDLLTKDVSLFPNYDTPMNIAK
jgi:hypothetical protein